MKRNNNGFTLLEVMVAATVLSLGIVLIFQSFFSVLRAYDYCSGYLETSAFAQEKLWQAEDSVRREGALPAESAGEFFAGGREYVWSLSLEPAGSENLYKVSVLVNWLAGKRENRIERTVYASYDKKEE